jgi:hypothetical protein
MAILALYVVGGPGRDQLAYWGLNPVHPYSGVVGTQDAFVYSPVAALAALPLHLLPYTVFRLLWLVLALACLLWLTRRWALAWIVFLPVAQELYTGNIHLLLAAAVVLGFQYPAAWSFVFLTKVTPGVGLLWFAVRREWRSLGIALGVTAALALTSLLMVPAWWSQWVGARAEHDRLHQGTVVRHSGLDPALAAPAACSWARRVGRTRGSPLDSPSGGDVGVTRAVDDELRHARWSGALRGMARERRSVRWRHPAPFARLCRACRRSLAAAAPRTARPCLMRGHGAGRCHALRAAPGVRRGGRRPSGGPKSRVRSQRPHDDAGTSSQGSAGPWPRRVSDCAGLWVARGRACA